MGMSAALGALTLLLAAAAGTPADRFQKANDDARAGDFPKAIAGYTEVASSGAESASLYWNWAQAASARGAFGESLWALLRARELDPWDRAVAREIEHVREAANLDPGEIAPEPLQGFARWSRRLRLAAVAVLLAVVSVLLHGLGAFLNAGRRLLRLSAAALVGAVLTGLPPLAGSLARPTGVVVRRGAPLLEAASPTAENVGALREGETVPILQESGVFVRIEDSSGARGWASVLDVRRLDRAPAAGR
jgi:hypothetical protein